jgi:hypothetical protein
VSEAAPRRRRDDGALIITFPRALPRERWAHVGELMGTDSIAATAPERQAVFARLTARRARKVDQQAVAILEWTG